MNFEKESRIEERSDAWGIGELRIRRVLPKFTRPKGSETMADFFGFPRRRCTKASPPWKSCELISLFRFSSWFMFKFHIPEKNWKEQIYYALQKNAADYSLMGDMREADRLHFLELNSESVVLLIGGGFGNTMFALSSMCKRVLCLSRICASTNF